MSTGKHIVIGGGGGFIGRAVTDALRARGDRVTWISRYPGADRLTWKELAANGLPVCDAVINLAGQHILDPRRRWTDAYRDEVIISRIRTTRAVVDAINASNEPPEVFISTAGKCFYGIARVEDPDDVPALDEYSDPHAHPDMEQDFPSELVAQWEAAASGVDTAYTRHVRLRIGVVLGAIERKSYITRLWRIGRARGFLPIIRLPFCLGVGAYLGTGRQVFPWIHIADMVGIILHTLYDPSLEGLYNAVAPETATNREFTDRFSHYLRRPVVWSMPEWLIERAVGRDRASILVRGQKVLPRRTLESGYRFHFPDIDSAMSDLVRITF